jgi:thiamine-monophosphate kinase
VPGEFDLIAALRERVVAAGAPVASDRLVVGSGDDATVTAPSGAPVTSVDALIEGVHFDLELSPLRSVGHKALATALSDLAAMAADPGEAYLQLGLPERIDETGCLELADGFAAVAAAHGVAIAGGDLSRAPALVLAVTVVGYVSSPERAVRRSAAGPGDAVVVTGELGGAAAGLLLLRRPQLGEGIDPALAERLRARQLEPDPQLDAGRALADAGATAMIDISDGLGADAGHVAAASGVGVRIELDRLPIDDGVAKVAVAAGLDPIDLAAGGGEDYELLATLPPERVGKAGEAVRAAGGRLTEIGEVAAGARAELIDASGGVRAASGFDQLAPREPGAPS